MLGFPSKHWSTFYDENIGSALELVSESYCCSREWPANVYTEYTLLAAGYSSHTGIKYFHMEKFPEKKHLCTDYYLHLISFFNLKELKQYYQLLLVCFTSSEVWI